MLRRRCFLPTLLLSLLSFAMAGGTRGASPGEENPTLASRMRDMRDDLLRINEFFDTRLPGTLTKYNLTLNLSPKFSDLRDHEYVRYPFELRYGLTEGWELYGGVTPYHPNPFNSGRDHRWGLGETRLGFRHNVGRFLWFYDDATVGFEERTPLGEPPIDVIGHYMHLRPFITAERKLPWPDTTFYTNFSYDREVKTPGRETAPPSISPMHIAEVGPGLLYKPGEFGSFAEYRFRYIADNHGSHNAHDSKIGVLWDIPLARTQHYKLPGKWQLELAYKLNREEGVGEDRGLTARVSWRTSLREMLGAPEKSALSK